MPSDQLRRGGRHLREIVGLGLDLGTGGSIALGCIGFGFAFAFFGVWARRWIGRSARALVVRFPAPGDDGPL